MRVTENKKKSALGIDFMAHYSKGGLAHHAWGTDQCLFELPFCISAFYRDLPSASPLLVSFAALVPREYLDREE